MSFMLLGILNAQATGGGAGAFDLLETTTLASSASSVTFSGLDAYSDYKHLQIRAVVRSSRVDTNSFIRARVNGDSGSNYAEHLLRGNGSVVSSDAGTSQTSIPFGYTPAASETSGIFTPLVIDLLDFNNTSKNSTFRTLTGYPSSTLNAIELRSGLWINTNAVTSIQLYDAFSQNFIAGSRFSLYGVK